jgi:hypothetical protein
MVSWKSIGAVVASTVISVATACGAGSLMAKTTSRCASMMSFACWFTRHGHRNLGPKLIQKSTHGNTIRRIQTNTVSASLPLSPDSTIAASGWATQVMQSPPVRHAAGA